LQQPPMNTSTTEAHNSGEHSLAVSLYEGS